MDEMFWELLEEQHAHDVYMTIEQKGEPMIYSDGYSLTYFPKRNTIEIVMPQTMTTLTNTAAMVSNRKTVLTEAEEAAILSIVKAIVERREDG